MSDIRPIPLVDCAYCAGPSAGIRGDVVEVELWYPRSGNPTTVEIGLTDVRAADSVQIRYDFDRDGWQVLQASIFEWDADDPVCDPDWAEVAFIPAWQRDRERRKASTP